MYKRLSVNQSNLLLSLSDALDLASPELSQHQLRTAFIVWEMAKAARLAVADIEKLFISALFHDVGALSPDEKIDLHRSEVTNCEVHCILGEKLLAQFSIFRPASQIVRFHHTGWEHWEKSIDNPVVFQSQILVAADLLERSVNRRQYILHQDRDLISRISSLSGAVIHPDIVDIFRSATAREDFWLDLVSPRLYSILLHDGPCRAVEIDQSHLLEISELFRNLIDFRSRFTATHSSGVAASASAISRVFGFTESETEMMEVAGNLHDLGKMAVPNKILDKPDKLTAEEFAVMRQHTYFTYSVLNTIGGIQQIAEWAAFHHERLEGSGYPFHIDARKLNLGARIMAVADVFTALAEDRPYRDGMERQQVMAILTKMCTKGFLDARVVDVIEERYEEVIELMMARQARARESYARGFALLSGPAHGDRQEPK